jgi:virginiamycin B lyase
VASLPTPNLHAHDCVPWGITGGPDRNVWFTLYCGSGSSPPKTIGAIGRITATGAVTLFPLPDSPGIVPINITSGPDGALWFTEEDYSALNRAVPGGAIGRITVSGSLSEYHGSTIFLTGGAAAGLPSITAGPDGNLWFTEATGIGRITPTGQAIAFTFPSNSPFTPCGGVSLTKIVAGPDHHLWFSASNAFSNLNDGPVRPYVGKITLAGAVTAVPLPPIPSGASSCGPTSIATGPDGNLWAVEETGKGQIERITPTGSVTAFDIGACPEDITAGADGNLWSIALGAQGARVERITPKGEATAFAIPNLPNLDFSSTPTDLLTPTIARGPDGNIWFPYTLITATSSQQGIARVTPKGQMTAFAF